MANLINVKCPNCGVVLELPPEIDRALCVHCGGKLIFAKEETHYQPYEQNNAIACPHCSGKGQYFCQRCNGSGRCFNHYNVIHAGNKLYRHFCKGGRCPICQGSGSKGLFTNCSLCNGTGRCPACGGSAQCSHCQGRGIVPCTVCSGSGFKVFG